MEEIRTIPPDFYLVRFDETGSWSEDTVEACERLYATYLVDINEVTHLCSFMGSFCLYPITNYPKHCPTHDTDSECWCDIAREATTWEVIYVDCGIIEKQLTKREGFDFLHVESDWRQDEWERDVDYSELVNNIIQAYIEDSWEPWEGQDA